MPLEYALQYRGMFPDPEPWKLPQSFRAGLIAPLGIEVLPKQRVRRLKLYPWRFNIMVVGESGLGKTTFINTLFNSQLGQEVLQRGHGGSPKTVEITSCTYQLCEGDVVLWMNIVDTPGFGDCLNRTGDIEPIVKYIEEQYDEHMESEHETKLRMDHEDNRVHLILYFMKPHGSGRLRPLDLEFLTRLRSKANILPIVSKADTLGREEMAKFKQNLLRNFEDNGIEFYPFCNNKDWAQTEKYEPYFPFCVIGSEKYVEVDGKSVRGRKYPWGVSEVENADHCDFVHLRDFLFKSAIQEYIDITKYVHYSNYRAAKIKSERPFSIVGEDMTYENQIEEARKRMEEEVRQMEEEVKSSFIEKVKEREALLRGSEERLILKRKQLVKELDALRCKIEEERRNLSKTPEK